MRFENTGDLWIELMPGRVWDSSTEAACVGCGRVVMMVKGVSVCVDCWRGGVRYASLDAGVRVVGPFTSGLVKLDEVARLDVGGQQYRRWKPRVEQLFDGSMEMRHLVLTFDYTSVSDSERREVVRELFKVARHILDGYAVAGLIREEWKIKSKGVSTHFHLACVNRCMSKALAEVWLASIKGEWLIGTKGLGEYVRVEWYGYGTRCVGYLLGYLRKSYVDVSECGGDYDRAARCMVDYARERYRLRSLRDKGFRKRVGGPLDQLERESDGQFQYTPEGRGTRTEGVDPRRGAGGHERSYRCFMKNNLRPEGSPKWRFVRMFRTGGLV